MEPSSRIFDEFRAYWQLSEELIADASKDDLAHLLSATSPDDANVGLLRDGTEALVGVLAMVTGVGGVDIDASVQ